MRRFHITPICKILLPIVLVLACLCACGSGSGSSQPVSASGGGSLLEYGMPARQAEEIVGAPTAENPQMNLYADGVGLFFRNGALAAIKLTEPGFAVYGNIQVGAAEAQVLKAYKLPSTEFDGMIDVYYKDGQEVEFDINKHNEYDYVITFFMGDGVVRGIFATDAQYAKYFS